MYSYLISLPRRTKSLILLAIDLALIVWAYYFSFVLRLSQWWPDFWLMRSLPLLALLLVAGAIFNRTLRQHRTKLLGYETKAAAKLALWVISLIVSAVFGVFILGLNTPRTIPFIFGALMFFFVFGSRYLAILFLNWLRDKNSGRERIAIYGAGQGGIQMVSALSNSAEYRPNLFVDDNRNLQGLIISGLQVYDPSRLVDFVKSGKITKVFLAIPSLSATKKTILVKKMESLGCEVLELPSYVEMIEAGGFLRSLRPVSPDTLLGRDGVDLQTPEISQHYAGSNIFVSGAGGSIGSELCRKILLLKPSKLVMFDVSEFSLYQVERELRSLAEQHSTELIPVLGNILGRDRVAAHLKKHSIDIVLHAAAYKHVPMIEDNEIMGVRNNTLGTKVLAEASIKSGVKRFLMISTDKAVRPTNVMGASKRLAEIVVNDLAESNTNTVFSIVRFGNVLGSSGSVIPLFKEQLSNGGPITLTDKEVTRYFMTVPEAASLVLLAATFAEGGDVFLLDMGEPIKIYDLARKMIELSGLIVKDENQPDGDIEIEVVGLRPGEKLYEELLIGCNNLPTPHPKILRAKETSLTKSQLKKAMSEIEKAIDAEDKMQLRRALKNWVDGYQPAEH